MTLSVPSSDLGSLLQLNWTENCDRSEMPLQLYTSEEVSRMTPAQLRIIVVPMAERNANGHNMICRQCGWTGSIQMEKSKLYFKKYNIQSHLRSRFHKKESSIAQATLPASYFNKKDTYIEWRKALLRSVVYSYLPFASCGFDFSVTCFQYLGYDPPCATTITNDLCDAASYVITWVELLFQRIPLFSIEFDLWSSLAKDAILSVVLYFIIGTKRHKYGS